MRQRLDDIMEVVHIITDGIGKQKVGVEEIVEAILPLLQERIQVGVMEQIENTPVPYIREEIVEPVQALLQKRSVSEIVSWNRLLVSLCHRTWKRSLRGPRTFSSTLACASGSRSKMWRSFRA